MFVMPTLFVLYLSWALLTPGAAAGETPAAATASAAACAPGELDMLDWLTLDADLRADGHMTGDHPIYTVVEDDRFYWVKTPEGDTWDINRYTGSMIYLWITEREWRHPRDYKRHSHDFNMPMVPRCAAPGFPGTTVRVPDTSFTLVEDCREVDELAVGTAVFEVWGPYAAGRPGTEADRPPIGGDVPDGTPVVVVSYRHSCDLDFRDCRFKEEFVLTRRHGLVRHVGWSRDGEGFTLDSRSTFNRLARGTTTPVFPCAAETPAP